MKHLKSYQLFENQDIVMAGVKNALENKNLKLLKDLSIQYGDLIDYKFVIEYIVKHMIEPGKEIDEEYFYYIPASKEKDLLINMYNMIH